MYLLERPHSSEITFVLLAFCTLLLFLSSSKEATATTSQTVHLPFSYTPVGTCWDCPAEYYFIGAWVFNGNHELGQGNYFEAIGYFNLVLENDPTNIMALLGKGYALANIGKYDDALSLLDKALKAYPNNPYALEIKEDALYGNAVFLANVGKYQEAVTYYDEILKIDPKFAFTEMDMNVIQKFTK